MEWQKIFSPGSTFCADSCFSIHSIPILPREHIKYPGHSARSAGGKLQLHIYIHMHSSNLVLVCGFCIMQHCKLVYIWLYGTETAGALRGTIGAPVCVRSGGVGSMGAWLRPRPTF